LVELGCVLVVELVEMKDTIRVATMKVTSYLHEYVYTTDSSSFKSQCWQTARAISHRSQSAISSNWQMTADNALQSAVHLSAVPSTWHLVNVACLTM